jgi:hypothetical protein
MAAHVLHDGATVLCLHAGQARAASTDPRVTVGGQAVVTQATTHIVSGCAMPPPPGGNGPCVSAQWVSAAKRVRAGGVPVLLRDSHAVCTPTGTGVNVVLTQFRVQAT